MKRYQFKENFPDIIKIPIFGPHEMTQTSQLSTKIAIAAPCSVNWDTMVGDDKQRLCSGCSKNVYNISAMSRVEAEKLLKQSSEIPCLKFFRRHDGTIIFEDCPKGLRRLRNAARRTLKIASLFLAFCLSTLTSFAQDKGAEKQEKESPPRNFNLLWTLSEGGPSERGAFKNSKNSASTTFTPGALAQLGVPDRYVYFNDITPPNQTKNIGVDWSGSEAFSKALQLTNQRKFREAKVSFEEALSITAKTSYDPMYRSFIGNEYAKLLRRTGDYKKAKEVLEQTKFATAIASEKTTKPHH